MWSLNDPLLGYGEVIQRSSSDCLGLPRNRIQGLMLGNVSTLHNLEDFGWLTFSQLKRSASKHMIRYTYIYIYITAGQLRLAYWEDYHLKYTQHTQLGSFTYVYHLFWIGFLDFKNDLGWIPQGLSHPLGFCVTPLPLRGVLITAM